MLRLAMLLLLVPSLAHARQGPADPSLELLNRAQALVAAGKFQEAREPLDKAKALGGRPVMVALTLAKVHAALGDREAAFEELRRATTMGLGALPSQFAGDAHLAALKADGRYAEFERAMERNARPCEHDPVYRQFDYWLGTWDVRPNGAPSGTPPAANVITKAHNGCVIVESWTAPGQTGQSFNIYDRVAARWRQTWVDSTGGLHEYWGGLQDGNMVYEGEIPAPPGAGGGRVRTRLTFFRQADGTVRQFSERTADGGKTWVVNYDLIYTKRP